MDRGVVWTSRQGCTVNGAWIGGEFWDAYGSSQFSAIRLRQIKDGKTFGNVFLSPCNKLGLFVSPSLKKNAQPFLGLWTRLGVEDGGDLHRDEGLQVLFGDEVTGVLLKVKLTALPWTRVASCAQSGF